MIFLKSVKSLIYKFRKWSVNARLRDKIIFYYNNNTIHNEELKLALAYYLHNEISVFPYSFKNEYAYKELVIQNENGYNYYLLNGIKLYFKKNWSNQSCKSYIKSLLVEQDFRSPHAYCSNTFAPFQDETLLDIGAAEGNFSVLSLDKVKETIAFECNPDWYKALSKTMEPYSNVKVINKKVNCHTTKKTIALDDIPELFSKKLFIKIDVEGSERSVFNGMEKLLNSNENIRLAICTYHTYNDAADFEKFFRERGFKTEFSNGYMLYYFAKDLKPPYLRKGVLRVWK